MLTKSEIRERFMIEMNGQGGYGTPPEVFDNIVGTLIDYLTNLQRVEIRGFGNFTARKYKTYLGRNPKTKELCQIPAKSRPFFKAGKQLNEAINEVRVQSGEKAPILR